MLWKGVVDMLLERSFYFLRVFCNFKNKEPPIFDLTK